MEISQTGILAYEETTVFLCRFTIKETNLIQRNRHFDNGTRSRWCIAGGNRRTAVVG